MALPTAILKGIEKLDPMPVTAQKLVGMVNNEDVSLSQIAEVVEYDEALMSNILRVANSVYFQRGREIKDARSAVVRLGGSNILNIILGQFLRNISVAAPLYDLSEDDLWLHSVVAALAAEEVGRQTPVAIPEIARVAALVHDVGKLIMVRYIQADFRNVLALAARKNLSFVEAERELFGFDHAEVGGAVAREWGFPEEVRDAIERHHTYPLEDSHPVLDAVVLSNLVAKTMAVGLGAEGMNFDVDEGIRQRLQLNFNRFCLICANVETRLSKMKETYGVH